MWSNGVISTLLVKLNSFKFSSIKKVISNIYMSNTKKDNQKNIINQGQT